jgi:phosphoribosyl 1,2-cyclic phosphodiesterase
MEVRFLGVRGSVATSGSQVARIGGNTSCIEVVSQGERLILDAGTGLRGLGDELLKAGTPVKATLLWSHLHWDHVQGFPFFAPAYVPGSELKLFGPGVNGEVDLQRVLAQQMMPPNFPVPLSAMQGRLNFASALPNQPIELGPFKVTPFDLNHPQGCMGYRIDADGASFVYMTDVELSLSTLSPTVARVIEGADALVLDAQYTPDEYRTKKGWGHSSFVDAAQVAFATRAQRLFLFHHDPSHHDDQVESMAEEARTYFRASEPAREGKKVVLSA